MGSPLYMNDRSPMRLEPSSLGNKKAGQLARLGIWTSTAMVHLVAEANGERSDKVVKPQLASPQANAASPKGRARPMGARGRQSKLPISYENFPPHRTIIFVGSAPFPRITPSLRRFKAIKNAGVAPALSLCINSITLIHGLEHITRPARSSTPSATQGYLAWKPAQTRLNMPLRRPADFGSSSASCAPC